MKKSKAEKIGDIIGWTITSILAIPSLILLGYMTYSFIDIVVIG